MYFYDMSHKAVFANEPGMMYAECDENQHTRPVIRSENIALRLRRSEILRE